MKTIPITEKDKYPHIGIEDLGDGTCRLYEPGDEELLRSSLGSFMQFMEMVEAQKAQTNP